jgi:N-methylhydantoinase A
VSEVTAEWRVGVDIGGTFTDLVMLADDGRIAVAKVPSTTDDYARGILAGLAPLIAAQLVAPTRLRLVTHGATIASNAILEHKGARTGLITTRGFRDILEIRRMRVPRLYDLTWRKPPPLVERALRREVDERLTFRGEISQPLVMASVEAAVDRLLAEGVEAIAVCLLHSYANPIHERQISAYIRQRAPQIDLCLSCEVLPEIREYERTSTTVINAYVMPVVRRYLARLANGLATQGIVAPLLMMQSNGGTMTATAAAERPMHIIESGPAAGVVGARALAQTLDLPDLITVDIGGTTAKAAIIERGELTRASEYEVGGGIIAGARLLRGAGYLLRAPAIDLAEVGAGGGSLIWLDAAGGLNIGPQSAGAVPGPACYDQGGTAATVTDANLVLGYLNPTSLAGGAVRLNAALARQVIEEQVARPLGLSLAEAAHGAHVIAASQMIRAIRAVSSERGRDPRGYVLCAFGGNGPLFAASMARALEMTEVIIPPLPGLFSAVGLLRGTVEHHAARSLVVELATTTSATLQTALGELEAEALAQLALQGYPAARIELARSADLRYRGQSFELTVALPTGLLTARDLVDLTVAFGQEHERTYGHRAGAAEPVELVTLRLVARVAEPPSVAPAVATPAISGPVERDTIPTRRAAADAPTSRAVYFGPAHGWLATPIIDRDTLSERPSSGPLIVEEYDATAVVPPGATIARDAADNLRLRLR